MNLIEQLGGYEKAKIRLGSCDITLAYYQELDRQLLEHRRQHNIFEARDAVIRKWNGRLYYLIVDIDNDGQEFLIHHDKGAKFKDCRISDNICNFKHATDAEIKAGKRLEVK
ncbi:hypothetical protein [Acinetobacter sp. YH12073]|uniref:hypothetical protein n=1 Tax=Acinetobacter sp. YH12073 TaxID=2601069 RepID=UPI0015D257D6|nr:hypothetical protein [Acinetobacter sp. YH12073]